MNYAVGLIGMWIVSDGLYSWSLYRRSKSYSGDPQDFLHDHWVRLVRIICGVALIVLGVIR